MLVYRIYLKLGLETWLSQNKVSPAVFIFLTSQRSMGWQKKCNGLPLMLRGVHITAEVGFTARSVRCYKHQLSTSNYPAEAHPWATVKQVNYLLKVWFEILKFLLGFCSFLRSLCWSLPDGSHFLLIPVTSNFTSVWIDATQIPFIVLT